MIETHLREGDIERLCEYLFNHLIIDEDKIARLMGIYYKLCAELGEYEKDSSFGRNYEEIIRNARAHLIGCDKCLNTYSEFIHSRVDSSAGMIGKIFQEIGLIYDLKEFIKESEENIRGYDYLGVLENLE